MLPDSTTDVDLSPDISQLVIEDGTPVDNLIPKKQMRLLTEPPYSNPFGKPPDVVPEIVSDREGNELGRKLADHARMGVGDSIVYDPRQQLGTALLRAFERRGNHYQELIQTCDL